MFAPRQRRALAWPLLLLAACHADPPSAGLPPDGPRALRTATDAPGLGALFLAPFGPAVPRFAGAFDAQRDPQLVVCRVADVTATSCADAPLGEASRTAARGPLTLVTVPATPVGEEHYRSDWTVTAVSAGTTWRLRLLVDGVERARAHARMPAAGESRDALRAAGIVPLGDTRRLTLRWRLESGDRFVGGDPQAQAGTLLPERRHVAREDEFRADHPLLRGIPVARQHVLLSLDPATTVAELNALLVQHGAEIAGATPGRDVPAFVVLRLPVADAGALDQAVDALAAHPRVRAALPDIALRPTVHPGPSTTVDGGWTWEVTPAGGNWGWEAARVPALWNMGDAIRKRLARHPGTALPATGLVDLGFTTSHPDLAIERNLTPDRVGSHGVAVAGVVAATHGNGRGADGVNPFARLITYGINTSRSDDVGGEEGWVALGDVMGYGVEQVVRADPTVPVVAPILAFGWAYHGIFTGGDDANARFARRVATESGKLFRDRLIALERQHGSLPSIVVPAGNDSDQGGGMQDVRWASPYANAGLVHGAAPVIVVQAARRAPGRQGDAERAPYSNVGGHVSAAGSDITLLTGRGADTRSLEGTSYAAPFVAGVVGYLHALHPALPRPTMAQNPVRDLLVRTAVPIAGAGAAPMVDAFAAALAAPGLEREALHALVDVDDGTRDGNARTGAGADGIDADGDGGVGDGRIDMSDFRRWRDHWLQVTQPDGLALDGPATHPKRDLNGDGAVGAPAEENVHARLDFNGDGVLSATARRAVPGLGGGVARTDLEVLALLWEDDDDVDRSLLGSLLLSGDVHVDAGRCLDVPGAVRVQVRAVPVRDGDRFWARMHRAADGTRERTYTVAADASGRFGYDFEVEAQDAQGRVLAVARSRRFISPGSDQAWTPECVGLALSPRSATLTAGASLAAQLTVTGTPNARANVVATGGRIEELSGPDAGGVTRFRYVAPATAGTYLVIAESAAEPFARDTLRVTVTAGAEIQGISMGWSVRSLIWGNPTNWWLPTHVDSLTVGGYVSNPTQPVTTTRAGRWAGSFHPSLGPVSGSGTADARFTLTPVRDGGAMRGVVLDWQLAGTSTFGGDPLYGWAQISVTAQSRVDGTATLQLRGGNYRVVARCDGGTGGYARVRLVQGMMTVMDAFNTRPFDGTLALSGSYTLYVESSAQASGVASTASLGCQVRVE